MRPPLLPLPPGEGRGEGPAASTNRQVIPHVDDLGTTHAANAAFLRLARHGHVTCGSVMVPAPWFREIADHAGDHDIGIHLTLTSEWPSLRWAPISTTSRTSGLLDDDGYFPRDVATLARGLVPEAAEAELRAQIDRALAAGLRPTHLDAHMAAAMLAPLLPIHVRLAHEYGLFPVLPRSITWAPDPAAYAETLTTLDGANLPVIDHCRGTLAVNPDTLDQAWQATLEALPPGLTHLALHATQPGPEFTACAPQHAPWRHAEYELFASGRFTALLAQANIATTSTRALQERWLARGKEECPVSTSRISSWARSSTTPGPGPSRSPTTCSSAA